MLEKIKKINDKTQTDCDLSIIIPVHNGEKTLERCLSTLLINSGVTQEIILINDSSTDNSKEIIADCISKYPNIQIVNTNYNMGAGLARNLGLQRTSGEYVGFVDCDDWVDCNLFVTVIKCLRETNADIAVFGVRNEYGNSFNSKPRYIYTNQLTFPTNTALSLLSHNISNGEYISPMVCQKVYRSEFLQKNSLVFTGNHHFEDDVFSFLCFLKKGLVTLVPSVEYHYMQSHHSVSHKISKEYVYDFVKAFKCLREELEKQSAFDQVRENYISYMDKCLSSFFNVLTTEEQNVNIQKKYLMLLLSSLSEVISLEEIIEYVDLSRLQNFWR